MNKLLVLIIAGVSLLESPALGAQCTKKQGDAAVARILKQMQICEKHGRDPTCVQTIYAMAAFAQDNGCLPKKGGQFESPLGAGFGLKRSGEQ